MNHDLVQRILLLIIVYLAQSDARAIEFFPDNSLQRELTQRLQNLQTTLTSQNNKQLLRAPQAVKSFYSENTTPHWFDKNLSTSLALTWLKKLKQADLYGLELNDYPIDKLETELNLLQRQADTSRAAQLELLLTDSFLSFADHLRHGRLNPANLRPRSQRTVITTSDLQALRGYTSAKQLEQTISKFEPAHTSYRKLRKALAKLLVAQKAGGWHRILEGNTLQFGDRNPRIMDLRKRLAEYDATLVVKTNLYFDNKLLSAVKQFQQANGIKSDGIVGPQTLAMLNIPIEQRIRQVKNNLERWRWLPQDLGARFVSVNIPDFNLLMVENNQIKGRMKVSVGRKDRPTPIIASQIQYLVFNPYWHVPNNIAVKDFIPKIIAEPDYLTTLRVRVLLRDQGNSVEVDPRTINWQEFINTEAPFPYLLRQDPWQSNALGQVKFMFPNEQQIYLHDTPMRNLMNHSIRADSSGCIRLENAAALVDFVMRDNNNWTSDKTKELMMPNDVDLKEKVVNLMTPVPVYITYFNVQVDDNENLVYGSDPYEIDSLP